MRVDIPPSENKSNGASSSPGISSLPESQRKPNITDSIEEIRHRIMQGTLHQSCFMTLFATVLTLIAVESVILHSSKSKACGMLEMVRNLV